MNCVVKLEGGGVGIRRVCVWWLGVGVRGGSWRVCVVVGGGGGEREGELEGVCVCVYTQNSEYLFAALIDHSILQRTTDTTCDPKATCGNH